MTKLNSCTLNSAATVSPFIEYKAKEDHDCKAEKCVPHKCALGGRTLGVVGATNALYGS